MPAERLEERIRKLRLVRIVALPVTSNTVNASLARSRLWTLGTRNVCTLALGSNPAI